jgi:hypothetical protein
MNREHDHADAKRDVTVSVSLTGNGVLDASANVIVPEVKIKHVDLSFEIERELSLHFDLVSSIELSSEIEQTLALTFTI